MSEVQFKFKAKGEKSNLITINYSPFIDLLNDSVAHFKNHYHFEKLKSYIEQTDFASPKLKSQKETLIYHHVLSLKNLLLASCKNSKKKEKFELREIYFIIGKPMFLAGIIQSKHQNSESHISDLVRKRIEAFES